MSFSGSLEGGVELALGGAVDPDLDLAEWSLDLEAGDEEATCTTDFRQLDESGVDADLECVGLRDEAGRLFDVSGSFTAAP